MLCELDIMLAREDDDEPAVRTAKLLQTITKTIEECIQVTFDTQESNSNRKMPVLDLEVWVDSNEVKHRFYKKPVSSDYTITERSALSNSTKNNTMFMECIRWMQNCSPDTPWSEVSKHLSSYMNVMRISGYSQEVRYRIYKGAIMRHREMCDSIEKGERKYLYRSSKEIRQSKNDSTSWANTWFLKGTTR